MTVYPKIKAIPENVRKQIKLKEGQKLTVQNKLLLDAHVKQYKDAEKLMQQEYNREIQRLLKEDEIKQKEEKEKFKLLNLENKKGWDDHIKIKNLEQQILKDNDRLIAEITRTQNKEDFQCKEKVNIRTIQEEIEINKLLKRNRRKNGQRLKDHRTNDNDQGSQIMLGDSTFVKTGLTDYGAKYMDPSKQELLNKKRK